MKSEDHTSDQKPESKLKNQDRKEKPTSTPSHLGKPTPIEKIDPSGMVDYVQGDQPGGDKFFQRDR